MTENENKVCITKLTFHIFSRCSTGELKKLSDFYGNSIRLKNAGSVSVANAIKGRVGYFGEEEDENLYICECHRTALIKNFHTGDLCSAPASFAKHPTSEKRKSYRSVTYEETKLIKASTNELLAVGKGKTKTYSYYDTTITWVIISNVKHITFCLQNPSLCDVCSL